MNIGQSVMRDRFAIVNALSSLTVDLNARRSG
jgi:hypothetical protein